jgi:histidyl-tRNA synthetase
VTGSRVAGLSGFPEWAPPQRWAEARLVDRLRHTFELHGFAPLATRAVEPLSRLVRTGETDKEIYVLSRLHADDDGPVGDDRLGLHYDLTVPFARWIVENAGRVTFPFKRYQIQPVWRGERPQEGRFREFVQADVDVIGSAELPDHYEVDAALVMIEALHGLDVGRFRMRVSHRGLTEGFLRGIGMSDVGAGLAAIDKLAKIGPDGVGRLLSEAGTRGAQVAAVLEFAALRGPSAVADVLELAARHGATSDELSHGAERVSRVVAEADAVQPGAVQPDLSIARGLDYYTGTVYETELVGHEGLGSVCSGGRYDDLASDGERRHPGVGLSIGVTRLLSRVFGHGLSSSRHVPTCVLVAVSDEGARDRSDAVARALRRRDIPADTSPTAARYGRQIRHADRLGVPFVWFPGAEGAADEVRDIRSGQQVTADPASWTPPEEDRWPSLILPAHH